jgi:hypothetical protein
MSASCDSETSVARCAPPKLIRGFERNGIQLRPFRFGMQGKFSAMFPSTLAWRYHGLFGP